MVLKAQFCSTTKAFFGDAPIEKTEKMRTYWIFGSVGDHTKNLYLKYQCNDLRICLTACCNLHEVLLMSEILIFMLYALSNSQPTIREDLHACLPFP